MDDDQVPSDAQFGGRYDDFPRHSYLYIDEGLRALAMKLTKWNRTAVEAGAEPPYQEELPRIQETLDCFAPRLDAAQEQDAYFIEIGRVSVGSVRLWKAALLFQIHFEQQEYQFRKRQGSPQSALDSLANRIREIEQLAAEFRLPPAAILREVLPETASNTDTDGMYSTRTLQRSRKLHAD